VTSIKPSEQQSDDGAFLLQTSLRTPRAASDLQQRGEEIQAQINAKQASGTDIESRILEAQINAIVKSHAGSRKQQSPVSRKPDDELQGHINAIVMLARRIHSRIR